MDLGVLRGPHGLAFAGRKLYFTAEVNKVIGRYDPSSGKIDWVLGTGQNRTHMIVVSKDLGQIFTSNVNSATISIIERSLSAVGGPGQEDRRDPAAKVDRPNPNRIHPAAWEPQGVREHRIGTKRSSRWVEAAKALMCLPTVKNSGARTPGTVRFPIVDVKSKKVIWSGVVSYCSCSSFVDFLRCLL